MQRVTTESRTVSNVKDLNNKQEIFETYSPSKVPNSPMYTAGDKRLSGGLKTDIGSVVSNKFDDHFKKSNLNYVMRRTTYKI